MRIYNEVSTFLEVNREVPFCNRAKLDTGTFCNYNCSFCYYQGDLKKFTKLDVILERVDNLVKYEIDEVDLSGGESSIHPDWFTILDYCREKGLKISTLSNGYKFSDFKFIKNSQEHGLEEILFSLHGSNAELHDKLVGHVGAFNLLLKAIENAQKLGMRVRINCTIHNENYTYLREEYITLINKINPLEVNFITVNFFESTDRDAVSIDYDKISEVLKCAIDQLKYIKYVNVRYIPFCYMKGYEKHVCDYYQNIYDLYDWNLVTYVYGDLEDYLSDKLGSLYNQAKISRLEFYEKPKECLQCKHFYICDGIEKKLSVNVYPEEGAKIKDPIFYRKDFYADFRNEK